MRFPKNLFFFLMLFACTGQTAFGQTKLDANAAEKLIASTPNLQLVDVRTPEEVKAGFIAGAVKLDFYDPKFAENIGKMDKSKPILVYCAAGGRSGSAAEILVKMGFQKVYDLAGGFRDWKAKGKPAVTPK